MAVNRFVLNGISYHGHGAINEIPGIIASRGLKKAFVASDPDLVRFGVTKRVTDLLEKNGIPHICVDFPHSHHAMWNDPDKTEEFRKAVLSYCETYMP